METRRILHRPAGAAPVALLGLALAGCARPQVGADEDVFKTVDALFTAVTARDAKQLGACDGRLKEYRRQGKLPGEAADYLDGVVARARDGQWESAAHKLYDFMRAQKREGARDHPKKDLHTTPRTGKR
jgi:hypothetical protein